MVTVRRREAGIGSESKFHVDTTGQGEWDAAARVPPVGDAAVSSAVSDPVSPAVGTPSTLLTTLTDITLLRLAGSLDEHIRLGGSDRLI
jgi:hypothetical protein